MHERDRGEVLFSKTWWSYNAYPAGRCFVRSSLGREESTWVNSDADVPEGKVSKKQWPPFNVMPVLFHTSKPQGNVLGMTQVKVAGETRRERVIRQRKYAGHRI